MEITQISGVKIPKITFKQNDEDQYQNGCFELAETFDVSIIRNNLVLRFLDNIDYVTEFSKHIYYIYEGHNALDILYTQNCLYFGWKLYPELISTFDICFVKRFLYMYCREETESQKSFYKIMNDDLRSRDPNKIYRYINILALINKFIENGSLRNYNGKVYRATKLDENLIMKLVPGVKIVNTQFWSTSKDSKVPENYMIKQSWRNTLIICKSVKINIDIDFEKLNPFNEKEVLFLPFTEFKVEKVSNKTESGKQIFTIELTELGNRNFVNIENMQVENIKILGFKKILEKTLLENTMKIENLVKDFLNI